MSAPSDGPSRAATRRRLAPLAGLAALTLVVTGCSAVAGEDGSQPQPADGSASPSATSTSPSAAPESAASVRRNVPARGVRVDRVVRLTAEDGTFDSVVVRSGRKKLAGELSQDGTRWTSTQRLEPGKRYAVRTVAVDDAGIEAASRSSFRTQPLTLDQQTYPSLVPMPNETVGVGMPVIVRFDVPVTNRASIERHLEVTNTSNQRGSWHWMSDSEVHWRPVHYWKPGTKVTVEADINSIPAGNGVFGQLSRKASFTVGRSVIHRVDAASHQMRTFIDGKLARTTPITTGKPGFTTRSGVKVIVEKFRTRRMNSETVGIAAGSAEAYDIANVEYAMRVTYSGEFLHAAPWSVGSQGYANVSHGCTGMSTANAAWVYDVSKIGDVVEYTGTDRPMTLDNGYGDWNASFKDYREGSAL